VRHTRSFHAIYLSVLMHMDACTSAEHGAWSKCTNYELDTRVPLIIRAPLIPASVGQKTLAFAELVDLYPSLVVGGHTRQRPRSCPLASSMPDIAHPT
jgi:arylsulfatase A-like enzyme